MFINYISYQFHGDSNELLFTIVAFGFLFLIAANDD